MSKSQGNKTTSAGDPTTQRWMENSRAPRYCAAQLQQMRDTPCYDIALGLENLSRMITPEGPQRKQFNALAFNMRQVLQGLEKNGITPQRIQERKKYLFQLHLLGFQLCPPVTFYNLCRTDRDYGGWQEG